ncbi:MAG: DUF1853 family protein [Gramella sp.]|nr:DUF1853 family protein [Christiangramia sp.]
MKDLSITDQFQGFLKTADIFNNEQSFEFKTFEFPDINITSELRSDLEKIDHPRNSVMGKRMESFFEIAIKHSDRYELLASNIQIIENKNTLGELDLLLFDHQTSKPLHVELVYKLYVYDQAFPSEIQRWIGPNRKDSFSEKLKKLREKQFPLLYRSETFKYLDSLDIDIENTEQQLCFKSQLFTPENLDLNDQVINLESHTGAWYSYEEFLKKPWQDHLFNSPEKKNWSCDPTKNHNWFSYHDLLDTVQILFEKNKAPLIWMKTDTSFQRFFIVWW